MKQIMLLNVQLDVLQFVCCKGPHTLFGSICLTLCQLLYGRRSIALYVVPQYLVLISNSKFKARNGTKNRCWFFGISGLENSGKVLNFHGEIWVGKEDKTWINECRYFVVEQTSHHTADSHGKIQSIFRLASSRSSAVEWQRGSQSRASADFWGPRPACTKANVISRANTMPALIVCMLIQANIT